MKALRLLPLLALSACEVGPNYARPQLPTPPAYAEAAPTARTAITAEDADLSSWWSGLGDAELDSLVRRALKDNPDLEAAAAKVREARAQETSATAGLFPNVSGSGDAVKLDSQRNSKAQPSGSSGSSGSNGGSSGGGLAGLPIPSHLALYSAGFDATWEADIFGGVRRGIEAAKANAEAAEWARRDGQVSLAAETANAYLTLRAVQARITLGEAELKRQKDLFQLISARRQHGFVTELDVNQQNTQVAQAAAQIPQLQAQADAEIHALGVLIGQPPEALASELAAAAALPPPPMRLPTGLPSELLLRRPDLRQAERRLAAANAQIGVQTANLYPKLNLLGLASFASPQLQSLLSTQNFSTVGVGMLQVPLFDAGRREAAIKAAREEREQAFQAYRGAVLGAFREVEDALAKFRSEDERRTHLVEAAGSAERNLKIAQDQYGAGTVAFINVLQAENALLNSRDQLVQSDGQALSDLVSLYKALGGGWSAAG
jgi:NodT family efflux transporter outer membrane factor (OMF) lipoprotein